ncbi:MAG: AMP-binding enzyme [Bacilli bacterium]
MKGLVKIDNGELAIHKSLLALSDDTPLSGDFYKTGDAVEFADADKMSFRFTGRIGNFINVGGYKVNPEEVEDAIKSLDGVREAIVFGKPNSLLGNILCAEISIIPAAKVSESDIRTSLLKLLPQFKIPRIISFTDSIRLTRTGKIKRV